MFWVLVFLTHLAHDLGVLKTQSFFVPSIHVRIPTNI